MYDFESILRYLKTVLSEQGHSYAWLAQKTGRSESGIKKIMNSDDMPFKNLQEICAALGLDVGAVLEGSRRIPFRSLSFNKAQSEFFTENPDAFDFYWLLACEELSAEECRSRLGILEAQATRILRRLDQLGLIEWHSDRRIHRRLPRGVPLAWDSANSFVRAKSEEWASQLVKNCFEGSDKTYIFKLLELGLTREQAEEMGTRLTALVSEYVSLSRKSQGPIRLLVALKAGGFVARSSPSKIAERKSPGTMRPKAQL